VTSPDRSFQSYIDQHLKIKHVGTRQKSLGRLLFPPAVGHEARDASPRVSSSDQSIEILDSDKSTSHVGDSTSEEEGSVRDTVLSQPVRAVEYKISSLTAARLSQMSNDLKSISIPKNSKLDDDIVRMRGAIAEMSGQMDTFEEGVDRLVQEQESLDKKVDLLRDDSEKTRYQVDVLAARAREAGDGATSFMDRLKRVRLGIYKM
jgi:hypothetical protein